MLTQAEIIDVCTRVDTSFPLAAGAPDPVTLAKWLRDNVPAMSIGSTESNEKSRTRAIAGCAIYRAYDVTRTSPPSVRQAVEFSTVVALGVIGDPEIPLPDAEISILIFAHIQPDYVSKSFPDLHTKGWNEIRSNVGKAIRPSIKKLGQYLLGLQEPALTHWLKDELSSNADVITVDFIRGTCQCSQRNADLGYGDKKYGGETPLQRAENFCKKSHSLVAWDGRRKLFTYVWLSANGEGVPKYNTFRKSMAAAIALDMQLVAGMVLRCHPECKGIIEADDKCEQCRKLSHVKEPDWWMWLRGQRRKVYACRCANKQCGYLYYNYSGACPDCRRSSWGKKIQGSLRDHSVDIQPRLDTGRIAGGESSLDTDDWRADAWLDEMAKKVMAWPDGQKKSLIQTFFQTGTLICSDRESAKQALEDLWRSDQNVARAPTLFEFQEWCNELFHVLVSVRGAKSGEVEVHSDNPQDVESEVETADPDEEDDDSFDSSSFG